jgi:hypothetical protein
MAETVVIQFDVFLISVNPRLSAANSCQQTIYCPGDVVEPLVTGGPSFTIQIPLLTSLK